jgi:uncharacterized membrane protein
MRVRPAPPDAPGVERLLALSDGVVAIALTLLVLSLHVPHLPSNAQDANDAAWLARQLQDLTDPLISYVISFYVIAQFWLAHHRTFRLMSGHDEALAWWNFLFLFTITMLPFTSDLLGQYASNPLAVDIFALNLLLASLSTVIVVSVAQRKGLLKPGSHAVELRTGRVRSLGVGIVVVASMGVAWASPEVAKYMWFLIAVVPRVLYRFIERRSPLDKEHEVAPSSTIPR